MQAEVFNTPSKVKRYLEANGVGVDITMSADELKLTAQRTKFLKAGASPKIRLPPTDVELQAPTLSDGFKAICDRVASGQETRPSWVNVKVILLEIENRNYLIHRCAVPGCSGRVSSNMCEVCNANGPGNAEYYMKLVVADWDDKSIQMTFISSNAGGKALMGTTAERFMAFGADPIARADDLRILPFLASVAVKWAPRYNSVSLMANDWRRVPAEHGCVKASKTLKSIFESE